MGRLIDGRYRVLARPGEGAMGVVVLAYDESLGRRVAVKFLRVELLSPRFCRRFTEEAMAMARADIYSLGCIAYEIVTGRLPFESGNVTTTLLRHLTNEVCPPSSVCGHSFPELDGVILRALVKDPAKRTPTSDAFRRDLAAARLRTQEPVRILVVDDDDDFRYAIARVLERSFPDARVECVADGREALEAFDRDHPSVVITDLSMPGLDGLQLTETLRQRDPVSAIPIIVLTASGGAQEWRRLSVAGVDRFLVKPVVVDDVVAMVRRCLVERSSKPLRLA